MKRYLYIIVTLAAMSGLCLQSQAAMAQLQIAPVAVYMDEDNTTGRIVIRNSSAEPVDVEVDLLFGYPATDNDGSVYLKRYDSIPDDQPSAVEWIRIYPRLFELPPGERQTVRFAARPPAGLSTGEYWARPVVTAQLPQVIEEETGSGDITTRLNLRKRTILSINYRMGDVHTGVMMNNLSAEFGDETINVTANLERQGNAAFLGHYEIRLTDSNGYLHSSKKRDIAVYHDQYRNFEINSDDIPAGTYNIELELFTSDRSTDEIIQASPAAGTTTVTIP